MNQNCLLFVYGLLKPQYSPPKTVVNHWPDQIFGDLYCLGDYPGAINIEKSKNLVSGYVLEIHQTELEWLDDYEDVVSGEYRRIQVRTLEGHCCWVYEYLQDIPKDGAIIQNWEKTSS